MPALDNPRWEQFAQWIVAGKQQIEAYALAFGNSSDGAAVNASRLVDKQPVSDRIAELRRVVTSGLPVLSLQEKRSFLRSVVNTPAGKIDENDPLCQSYKRRVRTDKDGGITEEYEYDLPNKLKALELDAKLAGELDRDNGDRVNLAFFSIQMGTDGAVERPVIDVEQA